MPQSLPRDTIAGDLAAPGREVEIAAQMFIDQLVAGGVVLRGLPAQSIAHLRKAIELVVAVPNVGNRYQCERAALAEFLTRLMLKLGDRDDAGEVVRRASQWLDQEFPVRN